MKQQYIIFIIIIFVLAGVGALVFYFYKTQKNNSVTPSNNDNFIQTIVQSPAVEGNIINSGIAGQSIITGGKPFEASLEIYKASDFSKPFISIRTHNDGTFQVPLKPGSYVLKPADPDGSIAPVKRSYNFTIGDSQWLQVKIEYR